LLQLSCVIANVLQRVGEAAKLVKRGLAQ